MRNRLLRISSVALIGIGTSVAAQAPLSAIDWLSETVTEDRAAPTHNLDVTDNAAVEGITVRSLDEITLDSIGVLSAAELGLPKNLWGNAEPSAIIAALSGAELSNTLPAISHFQRQIMLMQANAPDSGDGSIFLMRADALLSLGALEEANALLQATQLNTPELFRRWFDISLLTGHEAHACNVLRKSGDFAPTYQARIFCLARNGDWDAAALTLNSAETLQVISTEDYDLIARFLDPDLYEGEPVPIPHTVPTPLTFRIYEAIGESIPTKTLPRAFAHSDLRPISGWKARIEAAERLAGAHALSSQELRDIYWERMPAASGDHWDRVRLFQSFDNAINSDNADAVSRILPEIYSQLSKTGLAHILSELYAGPLTQMELEEAADKIAFRIALLADPSDLNAPSLPITPTNVEIFLLALAKGEPDRVAPINNPHIQAIRDGFDGSAPSMSYRLLLNDDRVGEALFLAANEFDAGRDGDLELISRALRLLRYIGQDEAAQKFALQYLIMDQSI